MSGLTWREGGADPAPRGTRGFTLIEIIVGLTIIAVLVGIAIPTVQGLQDERLARAPLRELAALVTDVRSRAMRERRAYQIVFEAGGFHAAPYLHEYGTRDSFLEWLDAIQEPPDDNRIERQSVERTVIRRDGRFEGLFVEGEAESPGTAAGWRPPYVRSHAYGEGVACELRFWGDHEWGEVAPGVLRRWVFQPTGMLTPLRVRFTGREAFFEAGFDVLTGEVEGERSSVAEPAGGEVSGGRPRAS